MRCATATIEDNDTILSLNWAYGGDNGEVVVPAATAVVVYGTLGTHYPVIYETDDDEGVTISDAPEDNLLLGSDTEITTHGPNNEETGYKFYWLSYSEVNEITGIYEDIGFYYGAENGVAFASPAHRAWLPLPDGVSAKITSFIFDNDTSSGNGNGDSETTAIRTIESDETSAKLGDNIIYNLAGQRVNNMTRRGVYIIGGKKVVKK